MALNSWSIFAYGQVLVVCYTSHASLMTLAEPLRDRTSRNSVRNNVDFLVRGFVILTCVEGLTAF